MSGVNPGALGIFATIWAPSLTPPLSAHPLSARAPKHPTPVVLPYLIIVILALGIAAAQAGIGGVKLLYSLPAYGLIGLAALCSLFEPARRVSIGTRGWCLVSAIGLAAYVIARGNFATVDYLARPDIFMTLAALAVYLLTALFLSEARARLVFLFILFSFAAAHLACGIVQFTGGKVTFLSPWIEPLDYHFRATGFYLNPNHLAGLLEMLGLMAASLACWSNWRLAPRMMAGYAALICLIGVALTGSRGGYVSTLAGLIVFAGLSLYVVRRLRAAQFWPAFMAVVLLFSAAIGGSATLMLKSPTMSDRAPGLAEAKRLRLVMWDAAMTQFALSPIIGTGSGTYQIHGPHFRVEPVNPNVAAHVQNDYLELLCEYGIVGAVAGALFLGLHFSNAISGLGRILRELEDVGWGILNDELALLLGALAAIATLLVHSLFDCNLHVPGNTLVFAFLLSIPAAPTTEVLLPDDAAQEPLASHWLRFLAPVIGLYLLVVGTPRVEGEFYAECAEKEIAKKDYASAIRCAESGLAVEKRNPNLYYFLGEARLSLARASTSAPGLAVKERASALAALSAGLDLSPHDASLLVARARALDDAGRFSEAERDFQKAISADPNSYKAQREFGLYFQRQNKPREAERHFQRAMELGAGPDDPASIEFLKMHPRPAPIDEDP